MKTAPNLCKHGINQSYCAYCNSSPKTVQPKTTLSEEQEQACSFIRNNKRVFLTGKAGTGKSHIIRALKREYGDACCVTATTGIAARLIDGGTIHSFIGWKKGNILKPKKESFFINKRIRECELLIVDEVSMMSSRLLDLLFERIDQACGRWQPKILLVGDLLQLGPVDNREEEGDGKYPYESPHWGKFNVIKLTENHRQSKDEIDFMQALDDLRMGNRSEVLVNLILSRTFDKLPEDCTLLFARKRDVEEINTRKLEEIKERLCTSQWNWTSLIKGWEFEPDQRDSRFLKELKLKIGARIVMLNNDPDNEWVNGSTGTVLAIQQGQVTVQLDDGNKINVRKAIESINDPSGQPIYEISQYPMMLSWALTIHKAQGMTLSKVGVSLYGHFANGHTYTALSRCRMKDGLFLFGSLGDIMIDYRSLAICS